MGRPLAWSTMDLLMFLYSFWLWSHGVIAGVNQVVPRVFLPSVFYLLLGASTFFGESRLTLVWSISSACNLCEGADKAINLSILGCGCLLQPLHGFGKLSAGCCTPNWGGGWSKCHLDIRTVPNGILGLPCAVKPLLDCLCYHCHL